jgi:hypothetical protein
VMTGPDLAPCRDYSDDDEMLRHLVIAHGVQARTPAALIAARADLPNLRLLHGELAPAYFRWRSEAGADSDWPPDSPVLVVNQEILDAGGDTEVRLTYAVPAPAAPVTIADAPAALLAALPWVIRLELPGDCAASPPARGEYPCPLPAPWLFSGLEETDADGTYCTAHLRDVLDANPAEGARTGAALAALQGSFS